MSKRLHYWSRCTLVATLAVLVTFNPAWAGRGLRCWLNKRSECKPVCCEPIQVCHAVNDCECADCNSALAVETEVVMADQSCGPNTRVVPDCCDTAPSEPAQPPVDAGHSPEPTPAPADDQPPTQDSANHLPATEVKPESAPDHSPSDAVDTSSAQLVDPPVQPVPDIAQPEPLPPAQDVAIPAEPAVEAEVPAEPSAQDIFGQTEAPAAVVPSETDVLEAPVETVPPAADPLFDTPAVPEPGSDDPFDAPSNAQPEPAQVPEDDLFDSPAPSAEQADSDQPQADLFDAAPTPSAQPEPDLFDTPAAPTEQPEAELFDQPAEPTEPSDDLFDTPAAPTESNTDDLFGATTQSEAPADSADSAVSDDLFAEPGVESSAASATDDDLFSPANSGERKSDDDLFGTPAPSDSQTAPPIPSADGEDDLFGTPASQPESDSEPAPAEEDDLFGKKDQPEAQSIMVSQAAYRQWRDNTGNFEIEAKLAEIHTDYVRLLKTNGNYCKVPMRRLSDADRLFVQQIANRVADGSVKMVSLGDLSGK